MLNSKLFMFVMKPENKQKKRESELGYVENFLPGRKKSAKGHSGTLAHKEEVLSQTIKFHTRSLARVRNLLSSAHLPHA